MKVICAWCHAELEELPEEEAEKAHAVSHGICPTCTAYFFSDERKTLDHFLNHLDAPVLMVNAEGEVELANDKALALLGKTLDQVSGFRGGEVMECVYARLPEGCGNTIHCAACTIRMNVMKTFETGRSLRRVPAFLNQYRDRQVQKLDFLISTEKVDQVVLLQVDEIRQPTQ